MRGGPVLRQGSSWVDRVDRCQRLTASVHGTSKLCRVGLGKCQWEVEAPTGSQAVWVSFPRSVTECSKSTNLCPTLTLCFLLQILLVPAAACRYHHGATTLLLRHACPAGLLCCAGRTG